VQHGGCHAPGLARGAVAAGQRQRREMAEALEARAVDPQQFAAPGRVVGAQAHSIECQPDHRAAFAMLGTDRGDVRVVVLHRYGGDA
jgi:hypothetical protein